MCTAVSFKTNCHYFGRNLDLEISYGEEITITPRNFPLCFRDVSDQISHYALIGMAITRDGYPLYFDATNEHGLSAAGLNFPGNAFYRSPDKNKCNVASFELIPWILGQCRTVNDVLVLVKDLNITNASFSPDLQSSPLHWIVADRNKSIVIEATANGIQIQKNPWGILSNNPPFEYHLQNMCNYMNLSASESECRFSRNISLRPYSRGMAAIGLPGDFSSASRFVRAAFIKSNSVQPSNETASITQFFHILSLVEQPEGCVHINNKLEKTIYTSCCNTDLGIYYYTTYENRQISAVSMKNERLDSDSLIVYPLIHSQRIHQVN